MYQLAVWESGERLSDSAAKALYEGALAGKEPEASAQTAALEPFLREIEAKFLKNTPGFIAFEIEEDDYDLSEIVSHCIDESLVLYDAGRGRVLTSAGRHGTGAFVLIGEDLYRHFVNNPEDPDVDREIKALDEEENTFLIFEGPEGYVQTAYNGDEGYVLEWNRGSLEEHYVLAKEKVEQSEVISAFKLFLHNNTAGLETLPWEKMEF